MADRAEKMKTYIIQFSGWVYIDAPTKTAALHEFEDMPFEPADEIDWTEIHRLYHSDDEEDDDD